MKSRQERLLRIASAISDGEEIGWQHADREAADWAERNQIHQLQVIEKVTRLLRASRQTQAEPSELEIRGLIGEGSFAKVYRAWDPLLEREIALKKIDLEKLEPREELLAEGRLLARVRHPNVVIVHRAEMAGNCLQLWMELIHGRTLQETVDENGPLSAHESALIGAAICRALSAVHGAGLIHRDVKAQNVMREKGGRVVLMDFGAGVDLLLDWNAQETRLATPLYCAPEILLEGVQPTQQTDLYSLGVLLFFLVSGNFPVAEATLGELRQAHRSGQKQLLRDIRSDLPEPFLRLTEKALASDPRRRFRSAGEMEMALSEVLGLTRPAAIFSAPARLLCAWWGKIPSPRVAYAAVSAVVFLTLLWVVAVVAPGFDAADKCCKLQTRLFRLAETGPERMVSNSQVSVGDRLFLEVDSAQDIYLYILNEDLNGESFLLFPLPSLEQSNPIPSDRIVQLPGPIFGRQAYWQVTSAGGSERFLIVASLKRQPELEKASQALPHAAFGRPLKAAPLTENAAQHLRGIGGLIKETSGDPQILTLVCSIGDAEQVWVHQIELIHR